MALTFINCWFIIVLSKENTVFIYDFYYFSNNFKEGFCNEQI